jgi:hypothetical protein
MRWCRPRAPHSATHAGPGASSRPPDDRQDRTDVSEIQLDEFLAHLALHQLIFRLGARSSQLVLPIALAAAAVALAIADVSVRAAASTALLAAVPAYVDHWWPPLIGLALSFLCLLLSARQPSQVLVGPDPEEVRPRVEAAVLTGRAAGIDASPLRVVTWLLVDADRANRDAAESAHLGGWLTAGVVSLALTLLITGLAYWAVGRLA